MKPFPSNLESMTMMNMNSPTNRGESYLDTETRQTSTDVLIPAEDIKEQLYIPDRDTDRQTY